jgi:hypothetical protein
MLMLPHFLDNWLTDRGGVITFTRRPPSIRTGRFLAFISLRGSVEAKAIVRLEGLEMLEMPITASEIEPASFCLIA